MDGLDNMFKCGLGEYIAKRRDEILKKDTSYEALIDVYTDAMAKYEALKFPPETKFIINEYILAISSLGVNCENACYIAGFLDATDIMNLERIKKMILP